MNIALLLAATTVLLWPEIIGDETLEARPAERGASPSGGQKSDLKTSPRERDNLNMQDQGIVSRSVFMSHFRRQAFDLDLLQCLRSGGRESGSTLVAADLKSNGTLERVRKSDSATLLPDCAINLISTMKFPESGREMRASSHVLIWRVDW